MALPTATSSTATSPVGSNQQNRTRHQTRRQYVAPVDRSSIAPDPSRDADRLGGNVLRLSGSLARPGLRLGLYRRGLRRRWSGAAPRRGAGPCGCGPRSMPPRRGIESSSCFGGSARRCFRSGAAESSSKKRRAAPISLLNCQSSLILLMAEEGRFLRIAAAAGRLRRAVGGLVPVERSLVGWSVGTDRPGRSRT